MQTKCSASVLQGEEWAEAGRNQPGGLPANTHSWEVGSVTEWLRWQKVSINGWASTQNMVDAHNGTGFGHIKKKKSSHTRYNMPAPADIMLRDGARCERPQILLCDSVRTKHPKHTNPQTESRRCLPEAVCGGRVTGSECSWVRGFFCGWWKCSGIQQWGWLHKLVNILIISEW